MLYTAHSARMNTIFNSAAIIFLIIIMATIFTSSTLLDRLMLLLFVIIWLFAPQRQISHPELTPIEAARLQHFPEPYTLYGEGFGDEDPEQLPLHNESFGAEDRLRFPLPPIREESPSPPAPADSDA